MKKRILMMFVVATLSLVGTSETMATCLSGWAKVNHMDRRVGDQWTRVFVEQHSTTGNGPLYWFWTKEADIKDLASDAMNNSTTVWVTGTAATCGTSSSSTSGYGGYISRLEVFRNR